MKITNIRTKVLLVLLPFFILSFSILSVVSYYFSQRYLTESVNMTARSMGTDYANRIQANILQVMSHLEELANQPAIRVGDDQQQIVAALSDFHDRFGKFDSTNFIYPNGSAVRMAGDTVSLGDREYFKKVMETKKPYVSKPLLTKLQKKPAVVLAAPVLSKGQLVGVVMGTYLLDDLTDLMKQVSFKDTGYGFVGDKDGLLLAHPNLPEVVGKLNFSKKEIGKELNLQDTEMDSHLMELFQKGLTEQVEGSYTFGNIKRIGVFTPVNLPGNQQWDVVITAPEAEMTKELSTLAHVMFWVSLLFIVIAIGFILLISSRFTKPIKRLRDECQLLSEGDFRERHGQAQWGEDEIGQLQMGFRKMKATWRSLVSNVQSQAEHVASASEQLTASAQQSAQAATQVAGSIAHVADGSDKQVNVAEKMHNEAGQMIQKTESVSALAEQVADIAHNAAEKAEQGSVSIQQAVEQMNKIGQGSEAIQQAIRELSQGSQEISEIVTLIASIAGQTNLLALNAAIEAARAGEHGRGFAVVAEEVRKLAEESNKAAQEINSLIQKNEVNMEQAVHATQAGSDGVHSGIAMVHSAGETFTQIVNSIVQLSQQIEAIAGSIQEMADSSQLMTTSVEEISSFSKANSAETQTVSAATEEQSAAMQQIAASSQNLAKLAGDLQNAVSKFNL